MVKGRTTASGSPVAPRRPKPGDVKPARDTAPRQEEPGPLSANGPVEGQASPAAEEVGAPAPLIAATEAERRDRSNAGSLEREDSRKRLSDLKRLRERESKHFVNVPLDDEIKKRLKKAALENDVKMTVIMEAAIDQFLRDNGY